jgi:hypothetical protein
MPHERCLITARLAGPCARCRQPACPAPAGCSTTHGSLQHLLSYGGRRI